MQITESNQIVTYYKALVEKDESFVGIFFVGVKTTSIFCIAFDQRQFLFIIVNIFMINFLFSTETQLI